ncbi:ABC transporter permease [Thiospirillum jenense]|uniref:ABC transporter permease n=1 Tax=Thiospirillum jenense TaxID=1653858 RepID=A0A839HDI1_9GAMM|nr:ABC transporter permease [Thiospirillum jenense]MBB1126953.1 ABC transporter permease [Thiospirillum jenense]
MRHYSRYDTRIIFPAGHLPLFAIVLTSLKNQTGFWLIAQLKTGLTIHNLRKALADLIDGFLRIELWSTMGMQEIHDRYRRSMLGPFWLTISLGVMVLALGLLYAGILRQEVGDYLPYVAAGFTVWGLISGLILDGTRSFIASESLIRQLPGPLSLHVYRVLWTNLIIFAHNIWVYIITALIFSINPGWNVFYIIPGLLAVLINGLWIGVLFGLIGARFRDVPQIIASVVQLAFFLTPIIWRPEMLTGREFIMTGNPFYHLVEIVRSPLLGQAPTPEQWLSVLSITIVGWFITLVFYTVYRWRIAYWV